MYGIIRLIKRQIPESFKRGLFIRIVRIFLTPLNNVRILLWTYGQFRSAISGMSVDRDGNPLPWITYPAIDYLNQLDLSSLTVFEFGAGNSTRYWAGRVKSVVSVERNVRWYEKLRTKVPDNVHLIHALQDQEFVGAINKLRQKFDIIIIDSILRYECAVEAVNCLNEGGMIILDNSEAHVKTARYLREKGLLQIDMVGFVPIMHNLQATSLFFERSADFVTLDGVQPKWRQGMIVYPEKWSPEH